MGHSRIKGSIIIQIGIIPMRMILILSIPEIKISLDHTCIWTARSPDYEYDALPLHQKEFAERLQSLKDWKHCIFHCTLYLILLMIHYILKMFPLSLKLMHLVHILYSFPLRLIITLPTVTVTCAFLRYTQEEKMKAILKKMLAALDIAALAISMLLYISKCNN